jgi:hypothetical protein
MVAFGSKLQSCDGLEVCRIEYLATLRRVWSACMHHSLGYMAINGLEKRSSDFTVARIRVYVGCKRRSLTITIICLGRVLFVLKGTEHRPASIASFSDSMKSLIVLLFCTAEHLLLLITYFKCLFQPWSMGHPSSPSVENHFLPGRLGLSKAFFVSTFGCKSLNTLSSVISSGSLASILFVIVKPASFSAIPTADREEEAYIMRSLILEAVGQV